MSLSQIAPPAPPSASRPGPARRRRRLSAGVLVAASVLAVVGGRWALTEWHDRSPYPASAVTAHVSASVVTADRAHLRLDQLAGPGRLGAPFLVQGSTRQVVVGQLTFRTPHPGGQGGQYALVVLDKLDANKPVSMMWGIGPVGTNVGQGWDSRFSNAAHKYRWLRTLAVAGQSDSDFADDSSMAVMFSPTTRGPVTFTAKLGPTEGSVDPARRITVALLFLNDGGHVYWADRLLG